MTDTQIIQPEQSIDAEQLYQRAVALKNITGQNFLELGAILMKIRDLELWKTIHGGYDSFEVFLQASDLKYKKSTANFFINVYETFILKLGFPIEQIAQISQDRLSKITARVKEVTPEQAHELVSQAETLSFSDFRKNMEEQGVMSKRKLLVHHCETCHKLQIEYDMNEVCNCDSHLHIDPMSV